MSSRQERGAGARYLVTVELCSRGSGSRAHGSLAPHIGGEPRRSSIIPPHTGEPSEWRLSTELSTRARNRESSEIRVISRLSRSFLGTCCESYPQGPHTLLKRFNGGRGARHPGLEHNRVSIRVMGYITRGMPAPEHDEAPRRRPGGSASAGIEGSWRGRAEEPKTVTIKEGEQGEERYSIQELPPKGPRSQSGVGQSASQSGGVATHQVA